MIDFDAPLPVLETSRLRLRALTPADAPDLFAVFGNKEVARYTSSPPFAALAEAEAYIAERIPFFAQRTACLWGLERREDGRVIGTVTLFKLDLKQSRGELGYILGRELWGHGYAREAVIAALDFGVDRLGLRRIDADVDPRNRRSLELVDRLGFTREGYLAESFEVAGEIQDSVIFGLLASTWKRRRLGVRPMVRADRERVLAMLLVQLEEHGVGIAGEVLSRAIDGALDHPERGAFFVADPPGGGAGAVGVAYLAFTWTLEQGGLVAWLEELYVMPEQRGRGLGRALLEEATASAKSRGACGMDLEIERGHERVESLYVRAGFDRLSRTRWQKRFAQ